MNEKNKHQIETVSAIHQKTINFLLAYKKNCSRINDAIIQKIVANNELMINGCDPNMNKISHALSVHKFLIENVIEMCDDFILDFNQKCNDLCLHVYNDKDVCFIGSVTMILNWIIDLIEAINKKLISPDNVKFKAVLMEIP